MTARAVRHLLGIEGLSKESALQLLDSAKAFWEMNRRAVKKAPTLRGRTVINLFFENSTRTRTSFELAGKRLSADVVNISASTSSTKKGETLRDTVATLDAMAPDVVVIRHSASGAPHFVAQRTRAAVINAGDGLHEHPTQALLDAFTIRHHKGSLDGLEVLICGDITHSRVARSNILLLNLLGAKVRVVGPRTLLPREVESLGVSVFHELSPALEGVDVVMTLRIQQERLVNALIPNTREYSRTFGIDDGRLALAKKDAIVMHPGPLNRGVEISDAVADGPQSVVLDQVEAGVAVRMAVLYAYTPGGPHGEAE
ncbi:MAG TPA: aspartate carbamoyltransferase catalytic subunit [Polyangiaceae bacterium]|nr:aspartate carbamoyltransferase catalytic subunit [Polyangiaceae bacterium]